MKYFFLFSLLVLLCAYSGFAQTLEQMEGVVYRKGSGQRLSSITIVNKTNGNRTVSNDIGTFKLAVIKGDTIEFKGDSFRSKDTAVSRGSTLIVYLDKLPEPTALAEVTINSTSLKQDILQTKRIYRSKGVFYIGKPHYYYLFLKPMTFIYENFKGEVIAARKFKKIAANDLDGQEIRLHFNRDMVKTAVLNIPDDQIDDFLVDYWPTIQQVHSWSNYEMIQYIKRSYSNYNSQNTVAPDAGLNKNFDWG